MKKQISALDGVKIFLFAILANLAVQLAAGIIGENTGLLTNPTFVFLCMLAIQIVFFAVFFWGIILKGKFDRKLLLGDGDKLKLALSPIIAFTTLLAFFIPTILFMLLLSNLGLALPEMERMTTAADYIIGIFVIAVAAPICEELIFRGALLSSLRSITSDTKAVLLCAFAFMIMHMSPSQTMYQFLLGIVMSVSVILTGGILSAILIHSASNILSLLIDYTPLSQALDTALTYLLQNPFLLIIVTALLLAVGCAILYLLFKIFKKQKLPITVQDEYTVEPLLENENEGINTELKLKYDCKFAVMLYWLGAGFCTLMCFLVLIGGTLA